MKEAAEWLQRRNVNFNDMKLKTGKYATSLTLYREKDTDHSITWYKEQDRNGDGLGLRDNKHRKCRPSNGMN